MGREQGKSELHFKIFDSRLHASKPSSLQDRLWARAGANGKVNLTEAKIIAVRDLHLVAKKGSAIGAS